MQLIIIPATAAMKIQAAERFNRQEIQPAKDPTSENTQAAKKSIFFSSNHLLWLLYIIWLNETINEEFQIKVAIIKKIYSKLLNILELYRVEIISHLQVNE